MSARQQIDEAFALYHFEGCPYCTRVRKVLDELDLDVELRDTLYDGDNAAELVQATGRQTVPVLRIEQPDGSVRWLPESADIIAYLRKRFA